MFFAAHWQWEENFLYTIWGILDEILHYYTKRARKYRFYYGIQFSLYNTISMIRSFRSLHEFHE